MGILSRSSGELDVPVGGGESEAMRRLADVGQTLERLESGASVAEALPALALGLVRADGALLVRVEGSSVVRLTSRGVRLELGSAVWQEGVLGAAWSGQSRILSSGGARTASGVRPAAGPAGAPPASQRFGRDVPGRALIVPVTGGAEPWVLVVGRVGPGEVFAPADLAPLTILRALAEAALGRIRASSSLVEAAAREAAVLESCADVLVAVDAGGTVRAMSVAATERLGVGRERAMGRRLADVGTLAPLADVVGSGAARTPVTVTLHGATWVVRAVAHEGGHVLALTAPGDTSAAVAGAQVAAQRLDERGAEARVATWDEMERVTIRQALRHHGGSVARAAKALGVAKGTVYNKMRRYGIDLPTSAPSRGGPDDAAG